jgi:hypothetical protein
MGPQHRTYKKIVPSPRTCPHHAVVTIRPGVGQCLDCGAPCSILRA